MLTDTPQYIAWSFAAAILLPAVVRSASRLQDIRAARARRRTETTWPVRRVAVIGLAYYPTPGWVATLRDVDDRGGEIRPRLTLGHGDPPETVRRGREIRCRVGCHPGAPKGGARTYVLADP